MRHPPMRLRIAGVLVADLNLDEVRKVLRGLRVGKSGLVRARGSGGGCRDSGARHLPLRFEVRLGVADPGCWGASGSAC